MPRRTYPKRWPVGDPPRDYVAECWYCGASWPRSRMRKDADGHLACPDEPDGPTATELDEGNRRGMMAASARSHRPPIMRDGPEQVRVVRSVQILEPEEGDELATTVPFAVSGVVGGDVEQVRLTFGRPVLGLVPPVDLGTVSVVAGAWSATPTAPAGSYGIQELYAVGLVDGVVACSASRPVRIRVMDMRPHVDITAPASGTVLVVGIETTVSVEATDPQGDDDIASIVVTKQPSGDVLATLTGPSGSFGYTPDVADAGSVTAIRAVVTDQSGYTHTDEIACSVMSSEDYTISLGPDLYYYTGDASSKYVTLSGGDVTVMKDLSGNGKHMAPGTGKTAPALVESGGVNQVVFPILTEPGAGTDGLQTDINPGVLTDITEFLVFAADNIDSTTTREIAEWEMHNPDTGYLSFNWHWTIGKSGSNYSIRKVCGSLLDGAGKRITAGITTSRDTNLHVYAASYRGGEPLANRLRIWRDGSQQALTYTYLDDLYQLQATGTVRIGFNQLADPPSGSTSYYTQGRLVAYMCYYKRLPDDDIAYISNWLGTLT